jgi:hypothetical protein
MPIALHVEDLSASCNQNQRRIMYQELIADVIEIAPNGGATRRHSFLYKLLHRRANRQLRRVEAQLLDEEQLAGTQHSQKIEQGIRNTELISFQVRAQGFAEDIAGQTRALMHHRNNDRLAAEVLSDVNLAHASSNRVGQLVDQHKGDSKVAEAADIIMDQLLNKLRQRPIQ